MLRRTAVVVAAVVGLTLALAGTAAAHPLGNFTVNRYAGIDVAGDTIFVRYALDLAEIPAFQLGEEVRAPGFARTVAKRLELLVDGRNTAEIVARLRISDSTARTHVQSILSKLGVHSRLQAVALLHEEVARRSESAGAPDEREGALVGAGRSARARVSGP